MSIASKIFYAADQHLKETTLALMPEDPQAALLDLGCGDCKFTSKMVRKTKAKYVCVVDEIVERLKIAGDRGWYQAYGDLNRTLGLEGNSFDIIHAGQVIEHLNDTDIVIKEIKRILKPTGYAVISTPNLASWHNIVSLTFGKQPSVAMVSDEIPISELLEDKDMPKHRRIFTPDGLRRLLMYHGLSVTDMKGAGYYPFYGWMRRGLSDINPRHAVYIVAKVRKE